MRNSALSSSDVVVAILVMGIVTYLTRVGGVWLVSVIPVSGKLERLLHLLSASVLVVLTVTTTFSGDMARATGVLAACVVMLITRRALVALIFATLVTALMRAGGL